MDQYNDNVFVRALEIGTVVTTLTRTFNAWWKFDERARGAKVRNFHRLVFLWSIGCPKRNLDFGTTTFFLYDNCTFLATSLVQLIRKIETAMSNWNSQDQTTHQKTLILGYLLSNRGTAEHSALTSKDKETHPSSLPALRNQFFSPPSDQRNGTTTFPSFYPSQHSLMAGFCTV